MYVVSLSPEEGAIQTQLIADLRAALPGVVVGANRAEADLVIQYQQDDVIICVDCGDSNGTRGQYWMWFASVGSREFDLACGERVTKPLATVWGETHKLGSRPTKMAARELRKLLKESPK